MAFSIRISVSGTSATIRFERPNLEFISSVASYIEVPGPTPVASVPYLKSFIPWATYIGPASSRLMIRAADPILTIFPDRALRSGIKDLCLHLSILSDQDKIRDGIRNMTMNSEHMILFAMTMPISKPIVNFINISTMNPKNVVMEEAIIVVMVLLSPLLRAVTLSKPSSLSFS